jgi:hypothetical protein
MCNCFECIWFDFKTLFSHLSKSTPTYPTRIPHIGPALAPATVLPAAVLPATVLPASAPVRSECVCMCVCFVCVCVCVLVLAPTADKHQHSVLLSCIPTITGPPVESITQGMGVLCSPRPSNTTNSNSNSTNSNSNSTSLVIHEHGQNEEQLPTPEQQAWMDEQIEQQRKVVRMPSAGSPAYCKLMAGGARLGQVRELSRSRSDGSTTTKTDRSPRPVINPVPLQRQRSAPDGMCVLCSCVVA